MTDLLTYTHSDTAFYSLGYQTFRCSLIRRGGVAINCSEFLAPARIECHCQTWRKSLKNCCQARTLPQDGRSASGHVSRVCLGLRASLFNADDLD